MAGKISDMTAVAYVNSGDTIELLQGGNNKKLTLNPLELRASDNQIAVHNTDGTQGGTIGRDAGTGGIAVSSVNGNIYLLAGGSAGDVVLSCANAGKSVIFRGYLAGNVVATSQAVASQTADLHQWQDSNAVVLSRVTPHG